MNTLVKTGIAGLDEVLLGGVPRHNNLIVEGAPGSGKTTLGLGFIYAGAADYDEPGVIVSFELDAAKLLRDAAGFDWDLQGQIDAGKIKIIQTSPAVLLSEFRSADGAFAHALRAMGAKRLLIDGLTPMRLYAEVHDLPFREDVHVLIEGLNLLGVTTMVTAERDETIGTVPAHERFVFDTIISPATASAIASRSTTKTAIAAPRRPMLQPGAGFRLDQQDAGALLQAPSGHVGADAVLAALHATTAHASKHVMQYDIACGIALALVGARQAHHRAGWGRSRRCSNCSARSTSSPARSSRPCPARSRAAAVSACGA